MILTPGTLLISILPYYARVGFFLALGATSLISSHFYDSVYFMNAISTACIILLTYLSMSHVSLTRQRLASVLMLGCQDDHLNLSKSDPEYNNIANQINTLKRTLESKDELLKSCAKEAQFTAKELLSSSDQVAEGAQKESIALDELASTSEEMSSTISDIARRLLNTTDTASHTLNRSNHGSKALHELAEKIQAMGSTISQNQSQMQMLSHASEDITEFVERIEDITSQINLLALNAAIESARAGEAGRGFAVVANEVRTLAANTETVTQDISRLVTQMTEQVTQSHTNSQIMIQHSQEAQSALENANNMLDEIHNAAEQTRSEMQISSASIQDFQTANDELCQRLQEIAAVSEKQTKNSQNAKDMVKYLEWLSTHLAPKEA